VPVIPIDVLTLRMKVNLTALEKDRWFFSLRKFLKAHKSCCGLDLSNHIFANVDY
jgi:hypothetical protein